MTTPDTIRWMPPLAALALAGVLLAPAPAHAADLELHARLQGASVVSATASRATGEAYAWLDDAGRVRMEMAYGGLESDVSGAGLYVGKASENGDLVAELDVAPGGRAGRLDDIEITLSPDVAGRMRLGEAYVQVETTAHPDGEIRGQLVPQPVQLDDAVEPEERD